MSEPLKLTNIIRGTDWRETLAEWTIDGTVQDLSAYVWDCQFKAEQGTDKAITVAPTLAITADGLTITLSDTQTLELPTGVLFYNVLATQGDWTQEVVGGTVLVDAGVSVYD